MSTFIFLTRLLANHFLEFWSHTNKHFWGANDQMREATALKFKSQVSFGFGSLEVKRREQS